MSTSTADTARALGTLAAVIERHCPEIPRRIASLAANEPHKLVYWLGEATKRGESARTELEPLVVQVGPIPTTLAPVLQADFWLGYCLARYTQRKEATRLSTEGENR